MKTTLRIALLAGILLLMPNLNFGQTAPTLVALTDFAFFTSAGAFNNDGATVVTGDIGSFDSQVVGFPPGVVYGTKYVVGDPDLLAAKQEAEAIYAYLAAMAGATLINVQLGGQTLVPGLYTTGSGAAADLTGILTLDALNNPDAIFIIKIDGALTSGAGASVVLENGAKWENVYWQVDGAVSLNTNVVFAGNIFANGAIELLEQATLDGRGISVAGAISLHNNNVSIEETPANPSIDLVKTGTYVDITPAGLSPGDQITYSFVVTNTGDVSLTNVTLSDPLVSLTGGPIALLAPGASNSTAFTAVHILTQNDINNGTFSNSATVTGTPPSGPNVMDTDADVKIFAQIASIQLVKTGTYVDLAPSGLNAGDQITYSFVVTNTGNVSLTNVTLSDPLVSVTGGPIASLAPGASNSTAFTGVHTLTQNDINNGSFSNVATVTGTPPIGANVMDTDGDVRVFAQIASIQLVKTGTYVDLAPSGLNPGDQITYSFVVTNTGNVTLTGVTISDPVVNVTGGPIASLAPGASNSTSFTAIRTLTQNDINNGSFSNVATVTGTPPLGANVTDTDGDIRVFAQIASIQLQKTGTYVDLAPLGLNPGDQITYSFVVTNTGNVSLTNVTLMDPVVNVTGQPIAILAPGASNSTSYTAIHTLTQNDINNGSFTNVATVTGTPPSGPNVMDSDNDIKVFAQIASIQLVKTGIYEDLAPIGLNPGDQITYSFVVTNTGNVSLTNVIVSDPVVNVIGQPIALLAPGASNSTAFMAIHTLTQNDIDLGSFSNIATVRGTPPSGPTVIDTDDDIRVFAQIASIQLVKTGIYEDLAPIGLNPGDQITYSFVITNTGNVGLVGVTLSDPTVIVTGQPVSSLAPGESNSTSYTAIHTLTQNDINNGLFSNIAMVTGTPPSGPDVMDTDEDIKIFVQIASIQLEKTGIYVDNLPIGLNPGDQITYSFVITNTGNVALSNVTLQDPLVNVTGQPISSLAPGESNSISYTAIHTLTQNDINNGLFSNIATVTGTPPSGPDVMDTDDDIKIFLQIASIRLEKTGIYEDLAPLGLNPGDQIRYSFVITNTGNVALSNVTLQDPVVNVMGQPISSLAPGESNSTAFTAIHTLTQNDINNGLFSNIATVTGTPPSGPDVMDTDDDIKIFAQIASIQLQKTGIYVDLAPLGLNPGDQITYSFVVTNTGNISLTNVTLEDMLVEVMGEPIALLAPGESNSTSFTGIYILTQNDFNNGSFTNIATVTGTPPSGPDVMDTDDDIKVFVQIPSISVNKIANPLIYASVGDLITYTIEVRNTGNVRLLNVLVTDPMTGLEEIINVLDPGQMQRFIVSYLITEADMANGIVINIVTAIGHDAQDNLVMDDDDAIVTARLIPGLTLTKTANPQSFSMAGDVITYTIVVENTGETTLTQVVVTDPMTGLEEIIEILLPGERRIFIETYIVTQADVDSGSLINLVRAENEDVQEEEQEIIEAIPVPRIFVCKAAMQETYSYVGEIIEYGFIVYNIGNVTIFNVEVVDTLLGLSDLIPVFAPGEWQMFSATYAITQEDLERGFVWNTATATGTGPNGEIVTDDDRVQITTDYDPGITVTKTASQPTYSFVGEQITYTILVENTGNQILSEVEVTDQVLDFNETIEILLPGQSELFTALYSITLADINNRELLNTAMAKGKDPNGIDVEGSDSVMIRIEKNPELRVTKTANPQTYSAVGDEILYAILVENTGNQTITHITVMDPMIGLERVIIRLLEGESSTITKSYLITREDLDRGSLLNLVMVTGIDADGAEVTAQDEELITANQNPELTVIKSAEPLTYSLAGDVIEYTITVQNTGNVTISNIAVTDPLTGLSVQINSLQPGASQDFTENYTILAADIVNQQVLNVATATGRGPNQEQVTANDNAVVTYAARPSELTITKSASPEQVYAGEQVTYTIMVSNNNVSDADNVVVTDILPVGTTFVSASDGGTYSQPTNTVTWNIGDLSRNQSVTRYLVVGVNSDVAGGTVIPNHATVDSDTSESPVDSNLALVTVLEQADLAIVKTANVSQAYEGADVTYTLSITNHGPSTAHNVLVNDDLPTQVIFVSASLGGVYNQQTHSVQWQIYELEEGASLIRTINVRISTNVPATTVITNHSSVASDTYDNDLSNNQDSHQLISSGPQADVAVTKRVEQLPVYAGEHYSYLVDVTNNGPSDAVGVTVTDKLPSGTTYVSSDRNGVFNLAGHTVTWELAFLGVGQTETFMITLRVPSEISGGTILTNEVTALGETFDPDLTNNTFILNTPVTTPELFIPDVFTPDGDGINDEWVIRGLDRYPNNKVVILNRWGNRVFEASPYNNDWDGTNQFSPTVGGFELPTGTYFYVLDTGDPAKGILRGTIFLSR